MNNITFDLGILSVFNSNSSSSDTSPNANFLLLLNELIKLKHKAELEFNNKPEEAQIYDFQGSKYDITLPKKTTIFPRHKKIPLPSKIKTRWQTFAATKGIQKKKRSRMVFDENKEDWVPRWGARSIKKNRDQENWAIELKPEDRHDADPFRTKGLDKELKQEKNKLKTMKNLERKKGGLKKNPAINLKESKKKATKKTLEVAQVSTASLGKFDKKSHKKEPKIRAKIHHNKPNFKNLNDERRRDMDILNLINKNA